MIQEVINWISGQSDKVIFIIYLTIILISMSVSVFILIIFKKLSRERDKLLRTRYWHIISENLASLAVLSATIEATEIEYKRSIKTLKKLCRKSSKLTQWILEEIIKQKANLRGEASKTMSNVYRDLGLKYHSLKKLGSMGWSKKVEGIYELERMDQRECFSEFYRFLNSGNRDLRVAARIGLTSLAPNPLSFLDYITDELSEWEQMSVYHRLRSRSKDQLPDFSKYYNHPQISVVSFCLNMTVRFNYFELIPNIISLLKTTSAERRVIAVQALSELEAFQALETVRGFLLETEDIEQITEYLKFLGKIGDKSSGDLVSKFLNHPSTTVRIQAVNAAIKLDLEFEHLNAELREMFLNLKGELTYD